MRASSFTSKPAFPVGLHVLLLDSTTGSGSATASLLEECLYSVTVTASPQAALDVLLAKASTFDVLLADVATLGFRSLSPECSSSSLLVAARGARLPLLLMGNAPSEEDIMAGMRAGAADFMELPLSLSKLESIWQHVVPRAPQDGPSGHDDIAFADPCIDDFGDEFETYSAFPSSPQHSPLSLEGCDSADNCLSLDTATDELAVQQQQHHSGGDNAGVKCSSSSMRRYDSTTSTGFPAGDMFPLGGLLDWQVLPTVKTEAAGVSASAAAAAGATAAEVLLPPTPRERAPPAAATSPVPSRLPPPASLSRSASSARSGSLRLGSGAAAGRTGTASAGHSSGSGSGTKRKSAEFSSAPPPPTSLPFAAVGPSMPPQTLPMMPSTMWPAPPAAVLPMSLVPPAGRPWQGVMPLPPGQVWGQPMNPSAVAPGITPPIYNLPPLPPPAMSWAMGHSPTPFPAYPGPMMPFMHSMMSAARPFMGGGGFGGMMPPMHPPPMSLAMAPQQQLAPSPAPPALAPPPPQSPPQLRLQQAPQAPVATAAAVALPLELILPSCSGMGNDDDLCGGADLEASLHSSTMSSDDINLFIPDFDTGGGKLRKISSTSFLPSLELLLWEDLEHEEQDDQPLGCSSLVGGGLELDHSAFDLDCDLGPEMGFEGFDVKEEEPVEDQAAVGCGGAGGGSACDLLGLQLKKSMSLADLIETSLAM